MVKKPGKVLCCMFLLAILGDDPAKKPGKVKKIVRCDHATNQQKHCEYDVIQT